MNRLKRWGREGLIMLIMLLGLSLAMDWFRSPQAPPAWQELDLHTLTGESVSLHARSQQKPLLVYFWASWCSVCKLTTPSVNKLAAKGENVMSVALLSGDAQRLERWREKGGLTLPVINDPRGELSAQWQVSVTPTFVILYQGKVAHTTTGWTSYWGMKLRLWLAGI